MNHYPRHIGDWMRDTAHLSEVEECIYSRCLDQYYSREKPLPSDLQGVCRLVRANSREAKKAVSTVLGEFFTLEADGYHQKRCDAELAKYAEKSAKAAQSAAARWKHSDSERNANAYANASPNAKRTQSEGNASQEPITINQKPVNPSPPSGAKPDPVKQEIWTAGKALLAGEGMSEDRAGSYLGKLVKDYGQVLVLNAVRDAVATTPAKPSEWLQARCQERRKPQSKQAALEARNAAVAAAWTPPED